MSTNSEPLTGSELGRAARRAIRREALGNWQPSADRASPLAILAQQDQTRVPELVPVRYGRMLDSPFTFFRGAAAIMAADLGSRPHTGLQVQLCGDAHLSNFGVFEAPDRRLVFDLNDFDETLPGPFEWDVQRLVASFEIGGREREFSDEQRVGIVRRAARGYHAAMTEFAGMGELAVWYSRLDYEAITERWNASLTAEDRKRIERALKKARNKDSLRALKKLSEVVDGKVRIADRPPVLVPISKFAEGMDPEQLVPFMQALVERYRESLEPHHRFVAERYRYVDAGHKVVGVGSVGTRAWIVLTMGGLHDDPLFLQVKEAGRSVLEPYLEPSRFDQQGERVVSGQRLMQTASDIMLGWLRVDAIDGVTRDFYVRQLWDGKGSADVDGMGPETMVHYAELCGWTLARAHARSGDRAAIASYLGGGKRFEQAMIDFASAYADQNEADYRLLLSAEQAGELQVQRGA